MDKEIKTEITINASAEKIWKILTNFNDFPHWNPFITYAKGDIEVGNKIKISIKPENSNGMTFNPTILSKIQYRELSWLGTVLFKGVLDGEHKFELIDNGDNTTTFIQCEKFTGILVFLFNTEKTKKGFDAMNNRLKELAEN